MIRDITRDITVKSQACTISNCGPGLIKSHQFFFFPLTSFEVSSHNVIIVEIHACREGHTKMTWSSLNN